MMEPEKIYCQSCGEHIVTITGPNPDYSGVCNKCGAAHYIRSPEYPSLLADHKEMRELLGECISAMKESNEALAKEVDAYVRAEATITNNLILAKLKAFKERGK